MLPPWRDERRRDFWKCRPMWVGEKKSQQRWCHSVVLREVIVVMESTMVVSPGPEGVHGK
ncbi:hypothetical protein DPMN_140860 [Dreissena polymorpha]|uniref:Uncharacterized protein n=1 Tax=Dreissena polymorpha TaxID=45954 RepID=A0A9D4GB78_DREPO|nr:hypothetical protein DPMN_140860 [Dreissena polymorpha]